MNDLVAIARIIRPRGLKGETIADLLTDFPERFDALESVSAVLPDGQHRNLVLEKHWFQNGRVVLKFEGIDSPESAETIRNAEICISESEVAELAEDEFFDWELAGCEVRSVDGEAIGTVKELMRTGGTEILVIEGTTKEYLIPFATSICIEVDVKKKLIVVDPPEGLLEF
ncbi:MAG: ribosome maturation factor RimM [Acidobacteriota bacterium]